MREQPEVMAIWAEGQVDGAWVMGDSATNGLPWSRRNADLRHFSEETAGHTLVMGRKTFESLPESMKTHRSVVNRPLVVLTNSVPASLNILANYPWGVHTLVPSVHGVGTTDEILGRVRQLYWGKPIAVIGGPGIIEKFAAHYDRMVVSEVRAHRLEKFHGDILAPRMNFSTGSWFWQEPGFGLIDDPTITIKTYRRNR